MINLKKIQMPNNNIPIFLSIIAIAISLLGYLINRKNIDIVMRKERERENIKIAIKELKSTSDSLKKLPNYVGSIDLYLAISDILREIYEKDNLKLKIVFSDLEAHIPEYNKGKYKHKKIQYNANSINVSSLKEMMIKSTDSWQTHKNLGSFYLNFTVEPDIISNKSFDLTDLFSGLGAVKYNIDKLKMFEFLDSLNPEIIDNIDENCDELLNILTKFLQNKEYIIEFNRNIKPSEIESKVKDVLYFNRISEKTDYLSTEVVSKVDVLRKELTEKVLI